MPTPKDDKDPGLGRWPLRVEIRIAQPLHEEPKPKPPQLQARQYGGRLWHPRFWN